MVKKKLHPSVLEFKEFVKKNPKIVYEVRRGKATWQELFEDWYLLGEDDARWQGLLEKEADKRAKNKEWMSQLATLIKNMDPNELQRYVASLSQALGAIQGVISQLQGGNQSENPANNHQNPSRHPFPFRKD